MKYKNFLLFLIILLIPVFTLSYAQQEATPVDGFRYPIGEENETISEQINTTDSKKKNMEYHDSTGIPLNGNNDRRCKSNCSDWYNANDVGNFVVSSGGLHPGEDWNNSPDDRGESVYSIANGKVAYIHNYNSLGYCIVIKHTIPKNFTVLPYTGGEFSTKPNVIYSKYLHVTPTPTPTLSRGDVVSKGDKIATIKNITIFPPHLHFEIRTEVLDENNNPVDPCTYPNGNDNGYYSYDKSVVGTMLNSRNTEIAMIKMKADGILDPSDFIEANKNLSVNNEDKCTFNDTNDSSKDIIKFLCNAGIVSGYSDKTVHPNEKINRAEFAKIISIAKNNNDDFTQCEENEKIFSDVTYQSNSNATWYCKYVKYAKNNGIINGYGDGTFLPDNDINYHEVAKMVLTALGDITHDDEYWMNSNKRNWDGTAKKESYIGCADKLNLFSFNGDSYKSKTQCTSNLSGYCVYDKITRERAFAAIYNAIATSEKSFNNYCFQ